MNPSVRNPSIVLNSHVKQTSPRVWLMAVVVALASTVALSAWAQPPGGGGGMHGGMWGGQPQRMERLLSSINATDDQKARIQQIMQKAMGDMAGQREAGRALKDQARAIFTAPTVDANAAEQVRQQMLAQHDQGSRRMMAAMLEVSQVLTPAQRAQMAEQMQKHGQKRGPRHDRRHGEPRQG
ncbi:MAG: Spy/CpxP family protein refolding chaperone [Burkholderiales bacterium]